MEALRAARGCEAGELVGRMQIPRTPSLGSGSSPGPERHHPLSSHPKPSLLQVCPRVCLRLPFNVWPAPSDSKSHQTVKDGRGISP
jgi:hypothetical protein